MVAHAPPSCATHRRPGSCPRRLQVQAKIHIGAACRLLRPLTASTRRPGRRDAASSRPARRSSGSLAASWSTCSRQSRVTAHRQPVKPRETLGEETKPLRFAFHVPQMRLAVASYWQREDRVKGTVHLKPGRSDPTRVKACSEDNKTPAYDSAGDDGPGCGEPGERC